MVIGMEDVDLNTTSNWKTALKTVEFEEIKYTKLISFLLQKSKQEEIKYKWLKLINFLQVNEPGIVTARNVVEWYR